MTYTTPILDSGAPRRMWLRDACGGFAYFAIGASVVLSLLAGIVAFVADLTFFIPMAIAAVGVLLIVPMGMCGIVLAWWSLLGLSHSARLRAGDFRFAGIFSVLVSWASATAGEYALHLPPGHAIVFAIAWPLSIGAAVTFSAIQSRARRRT